MTILSKAASLVPYYTPNTHITVWPKIGLVQYKSIEILHGNRPKISMSPITFTISADALNKASYQDASQHGVAIIMPKAQEISENCPVQTKRQISLSSIMFTSHCLKKAVFTVFQDVTKINYYQYQCKSGKLCVLHVLMFNKYHVETKNWKTVFQFSCNCIF